MVQDNQPNILQQIRDAIVDQKYVVTPHALFEMREDRLDVVDVESAILTGSIRRVFHDDPRGVRYELLGTACDLSTNVGVVLRKTSVWLILTVYEIRE